MQQLCDQPEHTKPYMEKQLSVFLIYILHDDKIAAGIERRDVNSHIGHGR